MDYIADQFPQLKYNPFCGRLFKVFSSIDDNHMSFEDFLNLCSVMSENCPLKVKAAWAFKMFGIWVSAKFNKIIIKSFDLF